MLAPTALPLDPSENGFDVDVELPLPTEKTLLLELSRLCASGCCLVCGASAAMFSANELDWREEGAGGWDW
jgi:hypothetical protein